MKFYQYFVSYKEDLNIDNVQNNTKDLINNIVDLEAIIDYEALDVILEELSSNFNNEELLLINRIFYYSMKKCSGVYIIKDFMQNLALLRSLGHRAWEDKKYFESRLGMDTNNKMSETALLFTNKINLFFRLVDFEDNGMIKKSVLLDVLNSSFVQDILGNFDIKSVINKIYNDKQELPITKLENIFDKDEMLAKIADVVLS